MFKLHTILGVTFIIRDVTYINVQPGIDPITGQSCEASFIIIQGLQIKEHVCDESICIDLIQRDACNMRKYTIPWTSIHYIEEVDE